MKTFRIAHDAKSSRRRRCLKRWLVALAIGLVAWLGVSWFIAYRLIHRRRPVFAEPIPVVTWGRFEGHRLRSRDGETLGAWYLPGRGDAPVVLLLHGNGGSRKNVLSRAELLSARGCGVLLVSLRAHGDSTGDDNDVGYGARHDVIAAVDWLETHAPGRTIVIQGTSMGAAAALFASRELGCRVSGYILESPYRDLKTAVWNRIENALPGVIEGVVYRGLLVVSPLVLPHLDRISPVEAIAGVPGDVPILILAGGDDLMARPEEARALWEKTRSHAVLHIFEGSDHIRMIDTDPARYQAAVNGLIDAATR